MAYPLVMGLFLMLVPLSQAQLETSVFSRTVCDTTRFCSSDPTSQSSCDPQAGTCEAFASWKLSDDGSKLEMGLYAKAAGYVAFGFSRSPSMADSDVYACTSTNEVVRSQNAPSGFQNLAASQVGISDQSVTSANGVIFCRFSRDVSLGSEANFFDLSDSNGYYIIMAWGDAINGNALTQHSRMARFKEDQKTDFTATFSGDVTESPSGDVTESPSGDVTESPSGDVTDPPRDDVTDPPQIVFNRDVCGVSQSCSTQPDCDPEDADSCKAFASWKVSDDGTKLEMSLYAKSTSYVAFGFSKSGGMDNSDVYACLSTNKVVRSRNIDMGRENDAAAQVGISDESVTAVDGIISCRFSRVLSLPGEPNFFDLSDPMGYHVIMAWNGGLQGDRLSRHSFTERFFETRRTDFTMLSGVVTDSPDEMSVSPAASGCGTTMGCFSIPSGCDPATDCQAFSSWVANEDKTEVTFSVHATSETYVAIGFSKSGRMDNTEVHACTTDLAVVRSRNDGYQNIPEPLVGVSNEAVTFENGVIRCSFTRVTTLDVDSSFFDLSSGNEYTILLAWAGPLLDDGNIGQHLSREISPSTVDVTAIASVGTAPTGNAGIILRRIHGALMVLAWLCFASIGITTARYFKDLPGKMLGKPKWFSIHRGSMVLVFCLCIAAFVIVVVAVGGIYQIGGSHANIVRSIHAVFGIIVTVLCIINVIMALFRPHPGTPKRPIYNWAHWGVGTSAHIIAFLTILAGTANFTGGSQAPILSQLKPFLFWLVLGFVVFHFILWIIFAVSQACNKGDESNDIYLQAVNGAHQDPTPEVKESTLSPAMIGLYLVYLIVTFSIAVAVIITIFL